jgi:S1-C subfamily serine protease
LKMSKTLETLSESFANAVEARADSVLRIEGRRRLAASGIAWKEPGLIITANHVVQRDEKLNVGLPSGESLDAELIGRDPSLDLALLKVDNGIASEAWKLSDTIRVGHLVLALGRPGSDVMATHGIVGALGEAWRIPHQRGRDRLLQTDVVMYPGFSGGPLIDTQGSILGMNTSGLMRGISVTVPEEVVSNRVETLLEHGYIRRGYIGVSLQPVRLPSGMKQKIDQETGLLVAGVEEGSPAEEAEIFQGDVLVSIEDEPLRFPDDLLHELGIDRVGKEMSFRIIRGGKLIQIGVVVGDRK